MPDEVRAEAWKLLVLLEAVSDLEPSELPIQQPIKFELIVNLRTAKSLGLTIPESFRVRADEVIE